MNTDLKQTFFMHDRTFYKSFFTMMLLLVLQNIVTYSVNVADNIMLGSYSQTSLSAAAAVNQIQYILQQFTVMGLGEGIVILAGQYWGKGDPKTIERLSGIAMTCGAIVGAALTIVAFLIPDKLIGVFTSDPEIIAESVSYLRIIRYTYILFILTNVLLSTLRSMQIVRIAFIVSCAALCINVCINYTLIFGKFGAPKMGITGAAIGTLIATASEFVIVVIYIKKSRLVTIPFSITKMFHYTKSLFRDYLKVSIPCIASAIIFASATAVQTMIFGHLSGDALAASSAAGTFFQYVKMVPSGAAAAASVLIAKTIGVGKRDEIRQIVRTLQMIFIGTGLVTGMILFAIRGPVLSLYSMTEQARAYAMTQMAIQAVVAVFMSYQMPCQIGIIRGGGDTRYSMISDFIYSWCVVVPLGLLAAFVFQWPFAVVVWCLNCDQIIKCITVGHKTNSFTWIRTLASGK